MDDVGRSSSKAQQTATLYKAVDDAYQFIQNAHACYREYLSIVADRDLSSDEVLAIQQHGREYASAVIKYSEAVMAWLAHVETNREDAIKLIRKAASGM